MVGCSSARTGGAEEAQNDIHARPGSHGWAMRLDQGKNLIPASGASFLIMQDAVIGKTSFAGGQTPHHRQGTGDATMQDAGCRLQDAGCRMQIGETISRRCASRFMQEQRGKINRMKRAV